jgi:hypothetical protein
MSAQKLILDEVLRQHKESRAPKLSADKFFEVFSVDQILKDFDFSYDDINAGIFDGPNDGGIDWAYIVMNGSVVSMEEELTLPERGDLEIALLIGQSKNEDTFKETPIDRLKSRLEILLKLDADKAELAGIKDELIDCPLRGSKPSPLGEARG